MNVRTGKFMIFRAKATILTMSRPARVWLLILTWLGCAIPSHPEHRQRPCHGIPGRDRIYHDGKVGEGRVFSGRSELSSYGTGNNHNTWYAATMVDARGVEIPFMWTGMARS